MFRALMLLAVASLAAPVSAQDKIKVVIIDGQNNHAWAKTTPFLKKALEETGRFAVDVSTNLNPEKPQKPELPATTKFPPDLSAFQVVISNYNGQPWPAEFQKALESQLKAGKIGFVVFHAANNSFPGKWSEFDRMIGMGWRNNAYGERLFVDDSGKTQKEEKGKGPGAGELPNMPFQVQVRDFEHPVTKGMPKEWMHTADQLVHGLRGPVEDVHILATAYSDPKKGKQGTGKHEPMIWTVKYGQGRVFHTPMGHDLTSIGCVGFLTTIGRGTEWAATGTATLPIPGDFPTGEKASLRK